MKHSYHQKYEIYAACDCFPQQTYLFIDLVKIFVLKIHVIEYLYTTCIAPVYQIHNCIHTRIDKTYSTDDAEKHTLHPSKIVTGLQKKKHNGYGALFIILWSGLLMPIIWSICFSQRETTLTNTVHTYISGFIVIYLLWSYNECYTMIIAFLLKSL